MNKTAPFVLAAPLWVGPQIAETLGGPTMQAFAFGFAADEASFLDSLAAMRPVLREVKTAHALIDTAVATTIERMQRAGTTQAATYLVPVGALSVTSIARLDGAVLTTPLTLVYGELRDSLSTIRIDVASAIAR